MEQVLTGWSLSLSCAASPRCPPSSCSSASPPPVTWQQCNVRRLFSRLALLLLSHFHLLSPPSAGLPPCSAGQYVQAGKKQGCRTSPRPSGGAQVGRRPGGSISNPVPTLGRPQPVGRHLPRVPALISWCVCTPGSREGNIAHVPSKSLAFANCTNHTVNFVLVSANHLD